MKRRGGEEIDVLLDEAGITLGVERRRIYDIVNILEAMDIVEERQKNLYTWHTYVFNPHPYLLDFIANANTFFSFRHITQNNRDI